MTIWQIAAGDGARDYTDLFLEYDVMLIGPGSMGDFIKNEEAYEKQHMKNQIKSFCHNPQPGDLVLLRYGREVKAVGKIPQESENQYRWLSDFDDVLGWDLQHTRRVIWNVDCLDILENIQPVFSNYKQQPSFTAVHEDRIVSLQNALIHKIPDRPLKPLPVIKGGNYNQEELGVELFSAGLANSLVEEVLKTISQVQRLAVWYSSGNSGNRPSEHEIVAHMISPLMLGMGWSEQLLAVEWKNIDLAFFNNIPTDEDNCIMICEAKKPSQSLTSAYIQAKKYIQTRNLTNCKKIITADGKRLFLYEKEKGDWKEEPTGYVNLVNIKHENIFPLGTSGVKTLIELIPWIVMRTK